MLKRRQAREISLQALFQKEFCDEINYQDFINTFYCNNNIDSNIIEYSLNLFEGILNNKKDIDTIIQENSINWKIERMSFIDINIMRIAIYEILFSSPPIAPKIAINEAIELAKKFSNYDSSSFVNGILDNIVFQKPAKNIEKVSNININDQNKENKKSL